MSNMTKYKLREPRKKGYKRLKYGFKLFKLADKNENVGEWHEHPNHLTAMTYNLLEIVFFLNEGF